MTRDNDPVAALLPEPPPPAPMKRQVAIDAALRRFDGVEPLVDAVTLAPTRSGRVPFWRRPQVGFAVSLALIAIVGLPAIWRDVPREPSPPRAPRVVVADRVLEPASSDAAPIVAVTPPPSAVAVQDSAAPPPVEPSTADKSVAAPPAVMAPPPPPAAAAPPPAIVASAPVQRAAANANALAARGETLDRPVQRRALPPVVLAQNDGDDAGSIVVTGSRRSRTPKALRGDWNACTVVDPRPRLSTCRRLIGFESKSTANIADGIALAWQGDTTGAAHALDQVIATDPRSATAYLNRGLMKAGRGELDEALADLDLAVRYAPNQARNYYHRSLLRLQTGDIKGARADRRRAVDLDDSYRAILR